VDALGSVLGFVYGSEKLLALVKRQDDVGSSREGGAELAKMGWFETAGQMRWGVEIVGQGKDGSERNYQTLVGSSVIGSSVTTRLL